MRVLIACEESGAVRDEFLNLGHEAVSCDLMPSRSTHPKSSAHHIRADIRSVLRSYGGDRWDLMIAFPPCTRLAVSGARYFSKYKAEQEEALAFVRFLLEADIPKIALENPVGIISSRIRKPEQIIQPWMFGHPESKKTCLWLKGLPKLQSTNVLPLPACGYWSNQTPSGQNKLGPSPTRARDRAVTYKGVAQAMAEQWGGKA